MEYLKRALNICCRDCCVRRKDSDSSMQIILPPSKKMSTKDGVVNSSTYSYIVQPDFFIPDMGSEKPSQTYPNQRQRKQSAPPVLTQTVTVQPLGGARKLSGFMHGRLVEPKSTIQIHVNDDFSDNLNNNSTSIPGRQSPWRSPEGFSPTRRPSNRRLSVAHMGPNHSRRSSMSSFDISRDEVDSDMYESQELLHDANSNGRLCFSVAYDNDFEQLTVNVICANSLYNPEQSAVIKNSCVKVSLIPPPKKKPTKSSTSIQKGTSDPMYDETITFDGITIDTLQQCMVKLEMLGIDRSSKKRLCGVVMHELDITYANSSDDKNNKRVWKHIFGEGVIQGGEKGNLMITTCYLPTDNQVKINIIRGSQLTIREQDSKQFEGIYVKVALVSQGKMISKEKTKLVQPTVANPVFDELFAFTLPSNMIDQSCILVSVNGKTSSGRRVNIGYVTLGPPFFSVGTGLEQWTKMVSAPYTLIGKWHALSVGLKKDSFQNFNECNMF